MSTYKVSFWVDDHSDIVTYTVSESGREDAISTAEQQLRDDGYDHWNLKQVRTG